MCSGEYAALSISLLESIYLNYGPKADLGYGAVKKWSDYGRI